MRNLGRLSIPSSPYKSSPLATQDWQVNIRLAKLRESPISKRSHTPHSHIPDVISTWFLKEVAGTVPTVIPPVINRFNFWIIRLLILNMQQSKAHWRTPNYIQHPPPPRPAWGDYRANTVLQMPFFSFNSLLLWRKVVFSQMPLYWWVFLLAGNQLLISKGSFSWSIAYFSQISDDQWFCTWGVEGARAFACVWTVLGAAAPGEDPGHAGDKMPKQELDPQPSSCCAMMMATAAPLHITSSFNLFSVQTHTDRQTASIIQAQADTVVSHVAPKWCFPTDSSDIRPVHRSWLGLMMPLGLLIIISEKQRRRTSGRRCDESICRFTTRRHIPDAKKSFVAIKVKYTVIWPTLLGPSCSAITSQQDEGGHGDQWVHCLPQVKVLNNLPEDRSNGIWLLFVSSNVKCTLFFVTCCFGRAPPTPSNILI